MQFERNRLFDTPRDFFDFKGTAAMKLTSAATQEVCQQAIEFGLLVIRIEAGIWHNPGFEARVDGIWDGVDLPVTAAAAIANNRAASDFVRDGCPSYNAFIVTTVPLIKTATNEM